MKKSLKLIIGIVAIFTFGLNLSIDSNGEFSILSKAHADRPPVTTPPPPPPQKWAPISKKCYNDQFEVIGTKITCFAGEELTCTPRACPTPP